MASRRRRSILLAASAGALLMVMGSPVTASADGLTYYPIAPGVTVNVRSGPGTGYTVVRTLAVGAKVVIFCQTPGTTVTGTYGTTNIWDSIDDGEYVSDAYVKTGSDGYIRPRCA